MSVGGLRVLSSVIACVLLAAVGTKSEQQMIGKLYWILERLARCLASLFLPALPPTVWSLGFCTLLAHR